MTEIHFIGIIIGFLVVGYVLNFKQTNQVFKDLWNED